MHSAKPESENDHMTDKGKIVYNLIQYKASSYEFIQ